MPIAPDDRPDVPDSNSTPELEPQSTRRTAHRGPGQGRGPRGERLVRHFKIDHELTAEDRMSYEAMLLDPRSTVDSLLNWLRDRGYTKVSRGAVHRHRKHFELDVKGIRRDARVAAQFAALARHHGGPTSLADAGQFRFEQMFLEQLFRMKKTEALDSREWLELGRAMAALLGNRQLVEEQRAPKGQGKKRIDGVALSDKVRRILGVPLPGETVPGYGPDGRYIGGQGTVTGAGERFGKKRDEPSQN